MAPQTKTASEAGPIGHADSCWVFAIRLLSADCARPHFGALAITVDQNAIDGVSALAKRAYERLIDGSPTIVGIDFRRPRISEIVKGLLVSISSQFGKESKAQIEDFGDWYCRYRNDEDSLPDSLWSALMTELVSGHPSATPPNLSTSGFDIVQSSYNRVMAQTEQIRKSLSDALHQSAVTSWDRYLLSHTPDLPNELLTSLVLVIDARGFRRFWQTIQLTLSKSDFQAFKGWLEEQSAVVAPAMRGSMQSAAKK